MGGVMSSVILNGDTSGAVTLSVPAVAGTNTVTIPAATGTMIFKDANGITTLNSNSSQPPFIAQVNSSEVSRIDSAGSLYVGAASGGSSTGGGFGVVKAKGYNVKPGYSGTLGGNAFNIDWTGSAQLWVDTSNIGTITFISDYRIKRNIETQTESGLQKVLQLRPVTYQMANYGTLFKQGDEIKEGFIAHEVQAVIPSGAEGQKDDEHKIQCLRVDAILAVAVKAIQELNDKVIALEAQLGAK